MIVSLRLQRLVMRRDGMASTQVQRCNGMKKVNLDEQILRAAKEIVVKYIETGRISPNAFPENFKTIYQAVDEAVKQSADEETASESG
jgi:hypothetical protein